MIQRLCAVMPGRKTKSRKGFTLAELLIVVAIIAVLIAIAIPVFKSQLDSANTAVKNANIRTAMSMAAATDMLENKGAGATYKFVLNGQNLEPAKTGDTPYVTVVVGEAGKITSTDPAIDLS